MTANDSFREHLVRTLDYARRGLQADAEQLAERLGRIAVTLGQSDPLINELGELQSSATTFEAHCGRYAAYRQTLKDYDAFMAS